MTQKYEKLKTLLKELFQLDQPDLDFGLYRIMHSKSAEVTQFLDKDLLPQVKEAFALYKTADKVEVEKELAKVTAGIEAAGMDPEQSPKVKELLARLKTDVVDVAALESEVYDHLFSFFRRYYSEGDFLAKRVYKAGTYAIPYEGEEIKLYWANQDQYYIKSSEYLRDYAFRLRPEDEQKPMRVHFRLADAAEGEHGNVKAAEGKERRFRLAADRAVSVEGGELVIRFTYQPSPEKQKDLNAAAEAMILATGDSEAAAWVQDLKKPHVRTDGTIGESSRLRVHIDRYTGRHTFDYFIHKDLGGFLRRELDFYIKNEVMHLDDVENETAPRVEQYLSKIKVIRKIAGKIIDFLAQLEDFQKRLWLKKKFVVETSWCISLGVVPEEFYAEIAANEAQREEWVKLCAIDEIKTDMTMAGYSKPLKTNFLKGQPTLMLDTRHFDAGFAARLLAELGEVDDHTDGTVFYGENSSALALMAHRYRGSVKCIYMDPPYNTGGDGFAYKDTYQHSSWLAMMAHRLEWGKLLLSSQGVILCSIDDIELAAFRILMEYQFGTDSHIGTLVWKGATDNNPTRVAVEHEYISCHTKDRSELEDEWSTSDSEAKQRMLDAYERCAKLGGAVNDIAARFQEFAEQHRSDLGDLYRYRRVDARGPYAARRNMENPGKPGYMDDVIHPVTGKPCAKPYWGWRFPPITMKRLLAEDRIIFGETETKIPELKVYLQDVRFPLRSVFAIDARKGSNDLDRLFGTRKAFRNPKPVELLGHIFPFVAPAGCHVLDFFAGSGTTGHAVVDLNRADGGHRKFLLVEMGDHLNGVLLPRIKKVAFTPVWKDGKPARPASHEEIERGPRLVKVIRLESYEDALNNLDMRRTGMQQRTLGSSPKAQSSDALREQYVLRYMLDVETRGSQSLLNLQDFADPTAYKLRVKRPGSDESRETSVDLQETFHWLIGLNVRHIGAPQTFSATFERDTEGRLRLKGRLKQDATGPHWFRAITGTVPDGRKALIVWRKLTGQPEQDNLVLDEWFTKQGYSSKDSEFGLIYVNGGNNLENLRAPDQTWKVRLIEDDFHRLMFATEAV